MPSTIARLLAVLVLIGSTALASPVAIRDNASTCTWKNGQTFKQDIARSMQKAGSDSWTWLAKEERPSFNDFLADCCSTQDPSRKGGNNSQSLATADGAKGDVDISGQRDPNGVQFDGSEHAGAGTGKDDIDVKVPEKSLADPNANRKDIKASESLLPSPNSNRKGTDDVTADFPLAPTKDALKINGPSQNKKFEKVKVNGNVSKTGNGGDNSQSLAITADENNVDVSEQSNTNRKGSPNDVYGLPQVSPAGEVNESQSVPSAKTGEQATGDIKTGPGNGEQGKADAALNEGSQGDFGAGKAGIKAGQRNGTQGKGGAAINEGSQEGKVGGGDEKASLITITSDPIGMLAGQKPESEKVGGLRKEEASVVNEGEKCLCKA